MKKTKNKKQDAQKKRSIVHRPGYKKDKNCANYVYKQTFSSSVYVHRLCAVCCVAKRKKVVQKIKI